MIFTLGTAYLLTDFQAPYEFVLPTAKFVDQSRPLEAVALMQDDFTTEAAGVDVTLDNGNDVPPTNTNTFTPTSGTAPASGQPLVLAAVGDGADGVSNAGAVTDLIKEWEPNLFLYLGDVYEKGSVSEFLNWYDPTRYFGHFRDITDPTIGNHEYENDVAPGYFDYWDNVPHFYSVDAGDWHLISLDSTSQYDQFVPGTDQYDWLAKDLGADTAPCTLVYFHHPFLSVGPQGDRPQMQQIWSLLAAGGVDVVLTGHDHSYQRWKPLGGDDQPARNGMTQFVVGTGGHGIQGFVSSDPRFVTGDDVAPDAYGALRMELGPSGATYTFENIAHDIVDSGSIACQSGTRPGFADGFESGDLTGWTNSTGMVVQGVQVHRGLWAGRATSSGLPAFALANLEPPTDAVTYRMWFKPFQVGTSTFLGKLRGDAGAALLGVGLSASMHLTLRDNVTGETAKAPAKLRLDEWHGLKVRVDTAAGSVRVRLDGKRVPALSGPWSFDGGAIGRLQLGDNRSGGSFDVAFDDVLVRAFLGA